MAIKYRKKPVVVEAMLYDGTNHKEIYDWMGPPKYVRAVGAAPDYIYISTREGTMRADKGDYIIKGVKGEFYPCKPDIFNATYERVD